MTTRPRRWVSLAAASALVGSGMLALPQAMADYTYDEIPFTQYTAVETDSVETVGEGANGPLERAIDGNTSTYWHTKWQGGVDPLPHWFVIKISDEAVDLGKVDLVPRQSANGSGRVGEYDLYAIDTDQCENAAFDGASPVASGEFDGLLANRAATRSIELETPVSSNCVKVVYKTAWGGLSSSLPDTSPAERVGSLAEFRAFTATPSGEAPEPGVVEIVVPEGALEITDGDLVVRTHPDFPQVVDYRLGDAQIAGRYGDALTSFKIDGAARAVTVGTPEATGNSVTYPLTFEALPGVSMNAVITVDEGALTYTLTDIVDPNKAVNRIEIPGLNLVSVVGDNEVSTVYAATVSVNRGVSGDRKINVASAADQAGKGWMIVANNDQLAAGFETNAVGDNTTSGGGGSFDRYSYSVSKINGVPVGAVSPAQWTYRSGAVRTYDDGSGIGVDKDPTISVKIAGDVNADSVVDWQDGAVASRDIMRDIVGAEDVKNYVVSRIPFNIVSQATHPFLRTLDDTKRISLATDNLGQQVLLKGYQAEGHDSAQGDYDGHYNYRAGDLEDLQTLVTVGKEWNSTYGIHVNATETYSEAYAFSEDLLRMPPQAAWGWMNQSYYMNNQKDLATGAVLDRMADLRETFGPDSNLNWLYWDVYYPRGWEADRFAGELIDEGWRISSEWSDALILYNTWSHWANDENYGGSNNKGLNSQLIRFVENSYKDTWNPDPRLGNANVVEFEGWTGHVDYNPFIKNIWERNLPTKFLQQSNIMTWTPESITFENGTSVTSPLETIDGRTTPTNRTITFDGATVYDQGSYLLPWSNGGEDRLYYWNPSNEAATWELTDAWKSQASLTLFKLTDTGREQVGEIAVADGSISLPATEDDAAYVLYPTSAVPAPKAPNWGEASNIVDPGFFSGTLDAYETTGEAKIVKTNRGNFQAELGAGESSVAQTISLPAGTYSMWAWIEIEPGKTREVSVSVEGAGVTPMHLQNGEAGKVETIVDSSSALNATASDEKLRTFFQRVPVRFETDGSDVTFAVTAADGTARVSIDDLRVVSQKAPVDPAPTEDTVVFEDFEDVDNGYWPFVTGRTNQGGDARTQLAELHAPYSQSGWYGLTPQNQRVAQPGQKYLDNTLDGTWSLLAHQENRGMILRTVQSSVPLEIGYTYRVSFDYQAAWDNDYEIVLGEDVSTGSSWTERDVTVWPVEAARGAGWVDAEGNPGPGTQTFSQEFQVGTNNPMFIGVRKLGGQIQGDLVIDNFRLEIIAADPVSALTYTAIESDEPGFLAVELTGSLVVPEGEATDVTHALTIPDGWKLEPKTDGEDTATPGDPADQVWILKLPVDAVASEVTLTNGWTFAGEAGESTATTVVDPANIPLLDMLSGPDLAVADVSSQEDAGGEPAPNGFAEAAIDDDPSTYWHTAWSQSSPNPPHHITLEPSAEVEQCTFNGFEYTARGANNGKAKGYEIYVSEDGETWGEPVATGEFNGNTAPQVVHFAPTEGKFVKFVITSTIAGNAFGGAAEIRLGGTCDYVLPVVDKSDLEAAIDEGTAADIDGKTAESVAALNDAIAAGQAVLANDEATQDEVDAAAAAIRDAIAALADEPVPTPDPTPIPEKGNLFYIANDWVSKIAHKVISFGREGDEVFIGDWDGDGIDTIGLRRGNKIFLDNDWSGGNADIEFFYGKPGDELVIGDFDGDGRDSIGVRRGATFYLRNDLTSGWAQEQFTYGKSGDEVFVGDFDGDGIDTIGLRRGRTFFISNTLTHGWAEQSYVYGLASDEVFSGDFNGDGKDTVALRRGFVYYVKNTLGDGPADTFLPYGRVGDDAYVGDWDGDGIDTPMVHRYVK